MADITDQVVDFYNALFLGIFFEPFKGRITDRRRRDAVRSQVLEAAGAASQSLERFLVGQRHTQAQVECLLTNLSVVTAGLTVEQVSNQYVAPEGVVELLLAAPAAAEALRAVLKGGQETVFRVALYSVVQALMQIGPVIAEWQSIGFPSTFELTRRVVARLNDISAQLEELGKAGSEAADERFELLYRDYLSQRFYRVEAGTVRMTTNVSVDLRELFVMPNVVERSLSAPETGESAAELMALSKAREIFGRILNERGPGQKTPAGAPILAQIRSKPRNVVVGLPGSGKSTFFEWFQLKVASAEEEFVLAEQQAIPLLLRVRQLDPDRLPDGSALIAAATQSRDLAALMPPGWLDRQMSRGTAVFMLDGLDEVEPDVRDGVILPWFVRICRKYPRCAFLVSSRPVGYPAGLLREMSFSECDLLDFTPDQIKEYTRHWCTAIRLARNETLAEARREGAQDGELIVSGFAGDPYIESLARNPLMLSAICLVNYFEGGQLPKDRVVLYKLCVEGLLHNWDQRRGIRSDFTFEEKLRVSKEVALRMQLQDRAEYDSATVRAVFLAVLKDSARAEGLLKHIRHRTGLLLERRAGIFAFAHLTFQEYLAARAIHEGNQASADSEQLIREHRDARWQEVIALYCGLAPAPVARRIIEALIEQNDVKAGLLAEAYLSAGLELAEDQDLRPRVMRAVAIGEGDPLETRQNRFPVEEFAPIANNAAGRRSHSISHAFRWLQQHPSLINFAHMVRRLRRPNAISPDQAAELVFLVHSFGRDEVLVEISQNSSIYLLPGPEGYETQAELALEAMALRDDHSSGPGLDAAYVRALTAIATSPKVGRIFILRGPGLIVGPSPEGWREIRPLVERIIVRLRSAKQGSGNLEQWMQELDRRDGFAPESQPQQPPNRRSRRSAKKEA